MLFIRQLEEIKNPPKNELILDNAGGCGLSSDYLLNTGNNPATAPVRFAVSLCPALRKGAGMDREYIEYLSQPGYCCVQRPGTLPNPLNRRITV